MKNVNHFYEYVKIGLIISLFLLNALWMIGCAQTINVPKRSIDSGGVSAVEQNLEKTTDGEFEFLVKDDEAVVKRYTGNQTKVEVPEQFGGKEVCDIGPEAFYQNTQAVEIILPDNIEAIGDHSFYRCYALERANIPSSVNRIGTNPFFRCSSLMEIKVDEKNEFFSDDDGVLYDKDQTVLLVYPEGKLDRMYTIPETVKRIDGSAFGYDCKNLKNLIIPATVEDFPDYNLFLYPDELTLTVEKDSAAENYAKEYGIKYRYLE